MRSAMMRPPCFSVGMPTPMERPQMISAVATSDPQKVLPTPWRAPCRLTCSSSTNALMMIGCQGRSTSSIRCFSGSRHERASSIE
jgi:hypothetical protein